MDDETQTPAASAGGRWLIEPLGKASIFTSEQLTAEQLAFAETASAFVEGEVLPLQNDIENKKPGLLKELLRKAGALGLLMLDIPEAYDGLGTDKTTSMLVTEYMAQQASWAVTMGAHVGIGSLPIVFFGNEEQKKKYLPKLATGELIAAYALTEAGSGSDALAAKTTATEDGEHYVLNGVKQWITNAGFADVFTVFAKVAGKFTGFIVERTDAGVSIGAEEHKMGIRGSSTCEVILDNVRIPKDRLLGRVGKGHKIAFGILNIGRLKLGVGAVGGSKYALRLAVDYAKERRQFGKPIAEFGMIRQKLAKIACGIYATESMGYRTTGIIDAFIAQGSDAEKDRRTQQALEEYAIESSILKVYGTEQLDHTIDEALQIFGGYGYTEHFPIERLARDARINRIFEGTNEVNRLLIPGTLLKRAVMGRLPLVDFVAQVTAELANPDLIPMGVDGSIMGREKRSNELAKRIVAYVANIAIQKHMAELEERQDILGALADMLIDVYLMDSVVQRTAQNIPGFGREKTLIQREMTTLLVADAYDRVVQGGLRLAAGIAAEEELQVIAGNIERFHVVRPLNTFAASERVAAAVLEARGYPALQ
ncbi:MAG: acyl-CoA dehydrogenase family protein [Deltaproteobacteria bacterium]|nr:acyl-CoA dehydrogenase family protein [Deltaproteobacteria bacterium]